MRFPSWCAVYLVCRHNERSFLFFQDFEAFVSLDFESLEAVDYQNGYVSYCSASLSQVSEGFVTWRVYDQQSRDIHIFFQSLKQGSADFGECVYWEVACADVLGDSADFAVLDSAFSDFVQQLGFSCIDVTENRNDRLSYGQLLFLTVFQ